MDPKHFDALSRTLADGISRRQAVTRWGAAGTLAGIAAALGRGRGDAARLLMQAETCSLEIVANVRLGPSEGAILQGSTPGELRGEITFALGPEGRVDGGRWRLEGGGELAVVGQVTGRALTLRVQAGIGQTIVLVGAGEEDFATCMGATDGLLTGPQRGDIGDWHAAAMALAGAPATTPAAPIATSPPAAATATPGAANLTATPSPAPGAPTTTATTTATTTPTTTATPEPTATASPTPAPTETPAPPTPTPDPCPTGTVTCNGVCVDVSNDPANCGACGNVCSFICFAGQCTFLQACLSPQVFCGEVCVDLQTDPANCGACGNACGIIEPCVGGECQPAELSPDG